VPAGSLPPLPPPLSTEVLDSHCHLDMTLDGTAGAGTGDIDTAGTDAADITDGADGVRWLSIEEALARAASVGVTRLVHIGCDIDGARAAVDIATRFEPIVAGVALHPNEAPRILATQGKSALDEAWEEIDRLAAHPRVRAVGETGLDYFRTGEDGRAIQEESFRRHIEMAKRHGKALVIHDRDSHDAVLRVLADEGAPDVVVFHCFSGDAQMARTCVEQGWVLSFAGTVTFKNAEPLREALRVVPEDQLLVETDAPFLTPMPFRGRPNASYLIPWTVRAMAQVKGVDVDQMCGAIARTGWRIFGF
jgi:TatD DNase family protein